MELATVASKKTAVHDDFALEVARYMVSELRRFGATDGGLCAWIALPGFENYDADAVEFQKQARFMNLLVEVDALVRRARLQCQPSHTGIRCFKLTRALKKEVLLSTAGFRAPFEAMAKEADHRRREVERQRKAREPVVLFYSPPIDPEKPKHRPWV